MDAGQNPLHTVRRAILVVDLVESVRLMQQFEADVISRWRRFITEAQQLLPQHGGRLVRSLGDGMLIEFASAPRAAEVAGALHLRIARYNEGHSLESALHLRAGAHVADVVSDEIDVFGAGVNLASRLCSLASPGETVVSTDFRDGLVAGLDPDVEDLGECQLKNIAGTVRAFRIGRSSQPVVLPGFDTFATERPAFAALPLQCDPSDHDAEVVGEIVLDQLIHELSLCGAWRVISRLSMVSFRGRQPDLAELDKILKPTWVVSGRCRVIGTGVRLSLEVADVRSASVLWSEVLEIRTEELLHIDGGIGVRIVESMLHAIFAFELQRSRSQPLPTLGSHTLLFSAVALMHRMSRQEFMRAQALLELLCERHPRAPEPHAWFAKWHVMRFVQGWADSAEEEAARGRACAQRALAERSDHALGLAVDGLIAGLLRQDLDVAEQRYEAALAANSNEALAWLFLSALHAYRDRGAAAAEAALTAQRLSPLDPIRYFYDSFTAHALLAAGRAGEAIPFAERSLRANGSHLPTHRSLTVAQVLAGQPDAARRSATQLLQLAPDYTVASFLERYPGRESAFAARCGQALAEAGISAA